MAFLMSAVDVAAPKGVWEWFILDVFGFIANYGWRIVVFVVLLKLVLSPLDFYQRYKMRKNQRITEALKPQLEKLEKQYGQDKATLQQKQLELNRKAGMSYMSSCLPLIITLVLFITFYTALRSVSSYMEFKDYVEMYDAYVTTYNESGFDYETRITPATKGYKLSVDNFDAQKADEIDEWLKEVLESEDSFNAAVSSDEIKNDFSEGAYSILKRYKTEYLDNKDKSYSDYVNEHQGDNSSDSEEFNLNLAMSILMQVRAQEAAADVFENNRTQFLWIKSLWVADVPWSNSVPEWSSFKSAMSSKNYLDWTDNPGKVYLNDESLFNDMSRADGKTYNIVVAKIRERDDLYKTNGYLILVVLVVGLSLLSQFISTRQQKKSGQDLQASGMGMMKIMLWLMPIMLGAFALTSSSAFTVYLVVNSSMSLIINLITSLIVNLTDKSYRKKATDVVKHGRVDPNDRINKNRSK